MRKIMFVVFAITFTVLGGVGATTVLAKPVDPAPVQLPVAGTFSPRTGEAAVPFSGTVTVDSFVEQEGQLAVQGTLTGPAGLFAPLAVTVPALAVASDDAGSGCTVVISVTNAFIDPRFIIFLTGAQFTLSERAEPDAARELCRVVQTAAKDSADQSALARALNKVLRNA
jgi:hypothetical protein